MNDDLYRRRAPGMSALAQRLPGQRTPPDPSLEQPNAADLTYGWHHESSSDEEQDGDVVGRRRRDIIRENDDEDEAEEDRESDVFTDAEEEEDEQQRQIRQHLLHEEEDEQPERHVGSPFQRGSFYLLSLLNRWWYNGTGLEEEAREDDHNSDDQHTNQDPQQDDPRDSFVCRICFDGPGSVGEGGESLGKLIAPCKCRGTMKFVHQGCLTRWRATSRRQTSIMQCDQCGAPYRFKKSPFVGLATNKLLLMALSCYMFISLVWIVGYAAEATMAYMDESAVKTRNAQFGAQKKQSSYWPSWLAWDTSQEDMQRSPSLGNRLYSAINLDRTEDPGYYDYDDFYGYRYDYRYSYSEPVAYYTLIKAAVKYVGSGRAFNHLFSSIDNEADAGSSTPIVENIVSIEQQIQEEEKGWWSTLVDDWKYGVGGIWEGQRPSKKSETKEENSISTDSIDRGLPSQSEDTEQNIDQQKEPEDEEKKAEKSSSEMRSPKQKQQRERYDALTARTLNSDEKVIRPISRKRVRKGKDVKSKKNHGKPTFLERILLQLSLGASLVGMSSFLTLLLGISTWAPFHLNLGLGRGFARVARRRARGSGGSGGGGGEGEALVAVFLLFLVVVGIIRALFAVYRLTNYFAKRLLTRVEDIILDWGSEEDQAMEQNQEFQQPEAQNAFLPEQHIDRAQVHARNRWRERLNAPAWTMRFRRRNADVVDHQ